MATKQFELSWLGVYRESGNSYVGGSTIQVGSSSAYNSYLGIPSGVRTALKTSRTTPTLKIKFNVTNADAEFDFGAHKETSNKASGTMPWYTYIGLHPIYNTTGWKTIDLTDAFMNAYIKGTYQGIVMYGSYAGGYGEAYGRNAGSNNAYFEVTGTWNTPPEYPNIVSPVSSSQFSNSIPCSWAKATDAETPSEQLSYQLRYFDGSKIANTWTLGANVLNYTIDATSYPETSSAYIEVRTFDGEDYSEWNRSAKFSIVKNIAPRKPTNLSPTGGQYVPYDKPMRFSWKSNDDGLQGAFKLTVRLKDNAGNIVNTYTTDWVTTSQNYYDYYDGFIVGQYDWIVETKDIQGLVSPVSDSAIFNTVEPSAIPTITEPAVGDFAFNTVTVSWYSGAQNSYELEVLSGGNVVFSETRFTQEKTRLVPYTLSNNTQYTIRVRIADYTGLYSDWGSVTITTNFTPPPQAVITLEFDNDSGSIVALWETPASGATEPDVSYSNIYRRQYNATEEQPWELIGENQQSTDSLIDYTPASNIVYQYKVVNYATNETSSDSAIADGAINFEHAYLHRARVITDILRITSGDSREQDIDLQGKAMFFSNRKLPLYEFGFSVENKVSVSWVVDTKEDFRLSLEFLQRKETMLYRDNNGRRFYCVVVNPKVSDKEVNGFEFSVDLLEVDYQGGLT